MTLSILCPLQPIPSCRASSSEVAPGQPFFSRSDHTDSLERFSVTDPCEQASPRGLAYPRAARTVRRGGPARPHPIDPSVPCRRMPGSLRTLANPTSLRSWQRLALDRLAGWEDGPFLISAAPGAGKTRPALELAKRLLASQTISRVAVLCPTTPLTRQWASAAAALGVQLAPDAPGPRPPRDFARRGRDLRARGERSARLGAEGRARHARDPRRGAPPRRGPRLGHRLPAGVRRRPAAAVAVGDAVSLRRHADPGRALRRRAPGDPRRLLHLRRGGGRRNLPPGDAS